MDTKLKWHKRVILELLWGVSLILSYTPRFFKYYMLKPFIASILILSRYRKNVIVENLRKSFPKKSIKEIAVIIFSSPKWW